MITWQRPGILADGNSSRFARGWWLPLRADPEPADIFMADTGRPSNVDTRQFATSPDRPAILGIGLVIAVFLCAGGS
jgi:hypothetical protein